MWSKIINNVEEIVGSACLVLVIVIVLLAIAFRSILGKPLVWADEWARLLFIWAILVGGAAGIKRQGLITVDLLYAHVPGNWKKAMDTLAFVFEALLLILLIYAGLMFTLAFTRDKTPMAGIPVVWLYSSVPVGGFLMLVRLVQAFILRVRSWKVHWSS